MIDEIKPAARSATVSEGTRHVAPTCPTEVEILKSFVRRPPEEIEHRGRGNNFGPRGTSPSQADRGQTSPRDDKPDEFGGILPAQVYRERPDGRCRTLLSAVLQATAADLERGGECRADALRWIRYCRLPGDRSLGFTLGEICERLDLDAQRTREWLVAIEVDLTASRRGRRAAASPLCHHQGEVE